MGIERVLVVGSGGREHALAWACRRDAPEVAIVVAPGNAGTAGIAENVAIEVTDAASVARLASERAVDLVIIGPDAAAAAGVADACHARGILVFGPTAAAARIESSKTFAKQVMDAAGIPTARWIHGDVADRGRLSAFVAELGGACVVKADGLALGKGVAVCGTVEEAERALEDCLSDERFGAAGRQVVVEELLTGPEVSVFGLSDGRSVRLLVPARDYKRIFDGDRGPNTGGMGAYSPVAELGSEWEWHLAPIIHAPIVQRMSEQGTPFHGVLYAGAILTAKGLHVLEYNVRFGDPEAQALLPRLESDLLRLLFRAARAGGLGQTEEESEDALLFRWSPRSAVTVTLASGGYPESASKGDPIAGLERVPAGVEVTHAGTALADHALVTAGGRVLNVTALGNGHDAAREAAYAAARMISFDAMQMRGDIAAAVAPEPGLRDVEEWMRAWYEDEPGAGVGAEVEYG
jgi:phosphoribosylamine--glycine ligase